MPLQWLRTTSHFDETDQSWVPNFLGRAQTGFSTIVSNGTGEPWFGIVCAPAASWTAWTQQGGQGQGPIKVFTTMEEAIAEAIRLGGTEEAARVAWVFCEGA